MTGINPEKRDENERIVRLSFKDWANSTIKRTHQPMGDGNMYLAVYGLWVQCNFKDHSNFIVIDGRERQGKSTLAAKFGALLDPNFSVERMPLHFTDFTRCLVNAKRGDCIVYDEAVTGMFSRESMTKINSMLVKTFMICAARNINFIFCIPNWWMIDRYLRDHAVTCLWHVPERGNYWYWDSIAAKRLSANGVKYMNHTAYAPTAKGHFNRFWPANLPKEDYDAKKAKHIDSMIEELEAFATDRINHSKKRFLSVRQLAETLGVTPDTIRKMVHNKAIPVIGGSGKGVGSLSRSWRFDVDEIRPILKERRIDLDKIL